MSAVRARPEALLGVRDVRPWRTDRVENANYGTQNRVCWEGVSCVWGKRKRVTPRI
jgi:hypothetical protein